MCLVDNVSCFGYLGIGIGARVANFVVANIVDSAAGYVGKAVGLVERDSEYFEHLTMKSWDDFSSHDYRYWHEDYKFVYNYPPH